MPEGVLSRTDCIVLVLDFYGMIRAFAFFAAVLYVRLLDLEDELDRRRKLAVTYCVLFTIKLFFITRK
jgi:hypothetical protein